MLSSSAAARAPAFAKKPSSAPSPWSRSAAPDPLAHHEALRPSRLPRVRALPGLPGSMIKEYFLNYEAMSNDFTIDLGQPAQRHAPRRHDEQD